MKPALSTYCSETHELHLKILTEIESDILRAPQGLSSKCKHLRCKTYPSILETTTKSTRNKEIALIGDHNYNTQRIVYVISCENCNQV